MRACLPLLLLLTLVLPAEASDWRRVLAAQDADALLRVRLRDGFTCEGRVLEVTRDSLVVGAAAGGHRTGTCALADIAGISRYGSRVARGWTVGARTGAVLGALGGFVLAGVVDAVGEGDEPVTTTDYAVATVGSATLVAVGTGAVGALLGSTHRRWHDLDPDPAPGPPPTRLSLHAGLATADDLRGRGHDGFHLRAWLPRRIGAALDVGPEATMSMTGAAYGLGGGPVLEVGDTFSFGLAARLSPPGCGLKPFLSAGLGWYDRDDSWLGLSGGLGLLWRTSGGSEAVLEVRDHGRSSGLDGEPSNSQVTVTAGWTIGR